MSLDLYNISIIDITDDMFHHIVPDWVDYIFENSLIKSSKTSKNRIFYHFFIKKTCDTVLNCKILGKKVIFINLSPKISANHNLKQRLTDISYDFCDFYKMVISLIRKIERNLPIRFIISTKNYKTYIEGLENNENKLNKLRIKVENSNFSSFTYSRVSKFVNKHGLNWLSENYFKSIKSKLLILS